jgi:hypothetical protein
MTVSLKNARLRTPNPFHFAIVFAWALFGFAPAVLAIAGDVPHWESLLAPLFYLGGLFTLARTWELRWRQLRGHLRVDEEGLFLEGKRIAARQKLLHGYVHVDRNQTYLRLVRRALLSPRPIDIQVDDEAQANEILAAMRLDAKTSVGEYKMLHGYRRASLLKSYSAMGGLLAVMVAFFYLITFDANAPLQVGSAIALALANIATLLLGITSVVHVSVGADGVFLRRHLMSRRFISFADIREVTMPKRDLTITLHDGTAITVHLPNDFSENVKDSSALVGRLRAALAAYREAPQAPRISGAEAKNEKHAFYRTSALPEDQLWRIVENPSAPTSERTAAANALSLELDAVGRKRLRVAADASASAQLRVALERLAAPISMEEDESATPAKRARLSR